MKKEFVTNIGDYSIYLRDSDYLVESAKGRQVGTFPTESEVREWITKLFEQDGKDGTR